MTLHVILGMGCRDACPYATLQALACDALATLPDGAVLHAIACWQPREQHPALTALATTLQAPLQAYTTQALAFFSPQLTHRSEALYQRTGLWGIAEAAALAEAAQRHRLGRKRLFYNSLHQSDASRSRLSSERLNKSWLLVPRCVARSGMATAALAAFTFND